MALAEERYVLFTTFRRDGRKVDTPVWIVGLDDGRLAFTTSSRSGKAKRLRAGSAVLLQPCDRRGRPVAGSEPMPAQARICTGGEELAQVRGRVAAKYRIGTRVIGLLRSLAARLGRPVPDSDCAIVIELLSSEPPSAD